MLLWLPSLPTACCHLPVRGQCRLQQTVAALLMQRLLRWLAAAAAAARGTCGCRQRQQLLS
jgi:hypothetical protein